MIIDNEAANKIKENKYKILRMSLLLGQDEYKQETITNFEEAARDVDKMNDEKYLKEIEKKFYDTLTLEEEEEKLTKLVDYIGGRIGQRNSLLSDFSNITGYELNNLPLIKYSDRLTEYKERLNNIREYLNNIEEINNLNIELSDLEDKINRAYKNKENAEKTNEENEQILLRKYKNILARNENYKDFEISKVDILLEKVRERVVESKKSLEIFNKSFNTLEVSGISKEDEKEYYSYVESAKENYYNNKENEYILTICKLVYSTEQEYDKLLFKRDKINNILQERLDLRKQLSIKDNDVMYELYELLDKQYKILEEEKKDLEDIDYLTSDIADKKERIKELEMDNQKVEILSLLKEFCIIDTYEELEDDYSKEELDNYDEDVIMPEDNLNDNYSNTTFDFDIPNNDMSLTDIPSNDESIPSEINEGTEEEQVEIQSATETIPYYEETNDLEKDNFKVDDSNLNLNNNESSGEDINILTETEPVADEHAPQVYETETPTPEINHFSENNSVIEENKVEEEIKDNQIVNVKNVENVDLTDAIKQANSVMKRVGKMLGVENIEEQIISVENENNDISSQAILPNSENQSLEEQNIKNLDLENVNTTSPQINEEINNVSIPENDNNIEINPANSFNNSVDTENNLFFQNDTTNDADSANNNFSLNNNPLANASFDNNFLNNGNFWDNAYEDGGLDTLPDLPQNGEVPSDNFFANNPIQDFSLPNNTEVQ